jgi:hypothetical protein
VFTCPYPEIHTKRTAADVNTKILFMLKIEG